MHGTRMFIYNFVKKTNLSSGFPARVDSAARLHTRVLKLQTFQMNIL